MIETTPFHLPVLLPQVLKYLAVKPGKKYIDATLGGGGYTDEILKLGGVVLGIDRDQDAIDYVRQKFNPPAGEQASKVKIGKDVNLVRGNFADIENIAKRNNFENADGIVFDLGLSSFQIEKSGRGFTYQKDEPLDMRAGGEDSITAFEVVNTYNKESLYEIFTKYAEELNSGAIASAIVRARSLEGKVRTTGKLASIITGALDRNIRITRKDANTVSGAINDKNNEKKSVARVFQAIRIEVNDELTNLKAGIEGAIRILTQHGNLVVVSYHSLEDRIVKIIFESYNHKKVIYKTTPRPVVADHWEIKSNLRARSAKLRAVTKL